MSNTILSVPLRFIARETPVRRGEPVTVSLPWPRGAVRDERQFQLIGPDGSPQVLQSRVLDRWPDGSVRWCLFDFLATVDGANDGYRVEVADSPRELDRLLRVESVSRTNPAPQIDTGSVRFRFHDAVYGTGFLAPQLVEGLTARPAVATLVLTLAGLQPQPIALEAQLIENGSIRARVALRSTDPLPLWITGIVDCFAESPVVRVQLSVRNPHSADHPGGNWNLGNGDFLDLRNLSIRLEFRDTYGDSFLQYSAEREQPFVHFKQKLELMQTSSGGDNWRSANHLDRHHQIPLAFSGYRLTVSGQTAEGRRAVPVILNDREDRFIGVAMPYFWENFPKAITADRDGINLDLFPVGTEHELQGGEQKTHTFYIAFGKDTVTDEPMIWCRSPLLCHADPKWYASTGVIPYLTPKAADPNAAYLALADQAIEGPDTFFTKREKIDEYGWRHFGDIYGDHEAVYWPGPEPMVSHYNNQYDCIAGFLYQFMRSGDPRWWELAIPCADHTCDIDIYHTDRDKTAYNRGLFWHTYHYAPADTGTHRSYPRSLRQGPQASTTTKMEQLGETAETLKKAYAIGGGPAASHNYNAGLMLAYFLTGNPLYHDTAIDLARFVIDMDDPRKTVFRWLSREYTGLATESGGGGYHGPGRASGNSVNALLVGHQLTGERAFLDKVEQIIRRVSHPQQDIDKLDLLNAELRWFYTMFLQSLGRYLDYKIELNELDRMYAYGRLTLLHYARWMANHERPILDTPEKLQYPTETWAAQDMRKAEVFQYAAKHAEGAEKAKFLERAEWFFQYVERALSEFPTKSLCRPVVLMLNFGWSHAWWQKHPDASAPSPTVRVSPEEFGAWRMFVPQKAKAMRRAKLLAMLGAMGFVLIVIVGIWLLIR